MACVGGDGAKTEVEEDVLHKTGMSKAAACLGELLQLIKSFSFTRL